MIFDALFTRDLFTIRRYGPGPKDSLGRTTQVLLSQTVVNGILAPTGTVEGETFVVDKFRATVALGVDLRAADEVLARGKRYTVEGTPFEAIVPKTKIGVVQAVLKYVGPVTP